MLKVSEHAARDILGELWEEILKRHWSFLEAEESMQKLEEHKKLEGYLKEFLCVAPHDRRFFLPETANVLRKSIQKSTSFSAYKAIIGFESISQYANNLFTKPWRKEFHILKMYSGYFQHEIKSNLIDGVQLFEAMGYRRLSDDILILDGPICPDQVTNVSRDAMAAYMECKIMKQIYSGLMAMGLTCSWQEIFHYRENNVGGPTQAIKNLIHIIQERRETNKENILNIDNFSHIGHRMPRQMPTYAQPGDSACQKCSNVQHANKVNYMTASQSNAFNNQCCIRGGPQFRHTQLNHVYNNIDNEHLMTKHAYPAECGTKPTMVPHGGQSHMAHSRSLEHYNELPIPLPHRHSFDNQQDGCIVGHHHKYYHPYHHQPQQNIYESPYDCLDGGSMGGSTVSYAAVAGAGPPPPPPISNVSTTYMHPYNHSGNRYPLPYNISNQLNELYTMPTIPCNNLKRDPYNGGVEHDYATITKKSNCETCLPPPASSGTRQVTMRQRSFPAEQLIDFNERLPILQHDNHAQNYRDYDAPSVMHNPHMGMLASESSSQLLSSEGSGVYARPSRVTHSRASTESSSAFEGQRYALDAADYSSGSKVRRDSKARERSSQVDASVERIKKNCLKHSSDRDRSRTYADDFMAAGQQSAEMAPTQRSTSQHHKNQDGVGSFESWDYVFQNLERAGYKDLDEREDQVVQNLELDSLNLASDGLIGNEKRRSKHNDTKAPLASGVQHIEKPAKAVPNTEEFESRAGVKQESSILKQTGMNTTVGPKKVAKGAATKARSMTADNNANESATTQVAMRRSEQRRSLASKANTAKRTTDNQPVSQQAAQTGEWSCHFCTYLNAAGVRICEMCCHSKDFNSEVAAAAMASSNAPTCV